MGFLFIHIYLIFHLVVNTNNNRLCLNKPDLHSHFIPAGMCSRTGRGRAQECVVMRHQFQDSPGFTCIWYMDKVCLGATEVCFWLLRSQEDGSWSDHGSLEYTGSGIQGTEGAGGSSSPFYTKCVQYECPPIFKGGRIGDNGIDHMVYHK